MSRLSGTFEWAPPSNGPAFHHRGYRPPLPATDWYRVDERYADMWRALRLNLHMIVTDQPAEELCHEAYVKLEPCGHVIMTLGLADKRASIFTDPRYWRDAFRPLFRKVTGLLQRDRLIDACLLALEGCHTELSKPPPPKRWWHRFHRRA